MAQDIKSESEQTKEDWMNNKWRPMMGWLYMATCTFDFVIFPILWSLLQTIAHTAQITQWQPLTLQGAGLYHIAMGAVLGLAAFGRTQEKLAGVTAPIQTVSVTRQETNFRTTGYVPSGPEIRMLNGKPAPQAAFQPEI